MKTVDAYISAQSPTVQIILKKMRSMVLTISPNAAEQISYGMPGYKLNGKPLIYFAAFTHHIGVYPTAAGIEAMASDLAPYKSAKGSVQFPFDQPMPFDLFERMIRNRVDACSSS